MTARFGAPPMFMRAGHWIPVPDHLWGKFSHQATPISEADFDHIVSHHEEHYGTGKAADRPGAGGA